MEYVNLSKKSLFFLTVLVLAASLTAAFTGSGAGTASDPYEISNLDELNQTRNNLTAHYELVSDIDASPTENWNSGKGWDPIGNSSFLGRPGQGFLGTLDGNENQIEKLTIYRPNETAVALFNGTTSGSSIGNLSLKEVNITGMDVAAGLAVSNRGKISNVHVTGTVTSIASELYSLTGGLVALNGGIITSSSSATDVSGKVLVGGIAGGNVNGNISSSYSTGNISSFGPLSNSGSAGIVGFNDYPGSNISNVYSRADVSGNNSAGLVGINSGGSVSEGYFAGSLSAQNVKGGVVRNNNNGNVSGVYWDQSKVQSMNSIGSGLTPAQLKNENNLDGFDFEDTWEFVDGVNDGYPVLQVFELGSGGGPGNGNDPPEIGISWTDNSDNEQGFRLYSNVSGSFKQIGKVGKNGNAFTHVLPGQNAVGRYVCYRVTAYNKFGESDPLEGCITP